MILKAVSVMQPHASLIMAGAKVVETRSWATSHRGPLLIQASGGFPMFAREWVKQPMFAEALADVITPGITKLMDVRFISGLPIGAVLGIVRLTNCLKMIEVDQAKRMIRAEYPAGETDWWQLTEMEWAFGLYQVGRFMWILEGPVALRYPFSCPGHLSLFPVEMPRTMADELAVAL